jgi:hypothetical protein
VKSDPDERADVAARHPERLRDLRALAVSHLLENRPGKYLLVTGDGENRRFGVRLRSSERITHVQTLFGPRLKRQSGGRAWAAEGRSSGPVVLFARVDAPGSASLDVLLRQPGQQPAEIRRQWNSGSFDVFSGEQGKRLADSSHVALNLFETKPAAAHAERGGISAQRLETLKALGYVQ